MVDIGVAGTALVWQLGKKYADQRCNEGKGCSWEKSWHAHSGEAGTPGVNEVPARPSS